MEKAAVIKVVAGGSKPAVGSDEWHKVRRDNHKEGEHIPSSDIHELRVLTNHH